MLWILIDNASSFSMCSRCNHNCEVCVGYAAACYNWAFANIYYWILIRCTQWYLQLVNYTTILLAKPGQNRRYLAIDYIKLQ